MIKYSVLAEYKCSNCNEIIYVPEYTKLQELAKFASAGECGHSWERLEVKQETTEQESPE